MYNAKSLKAEEFISDEEIRETLAYADANKDNVALIDEIIEKAKLRKGLNHREASVLLACEIPEKIQEVYALAEQIKKDFYGNRIVLFAPLYLSNYCVNGCVYCPYHKKNTHIARKKLTQKEIVKEVNGSMKILVDGGIRSGTDIFKALALGADGVLICRPFVVAVYGGGEEGVKLYIDKLGAELKDAMQMCGAHSVSEITRDMVRYYQD